MAVPPFERTPRRTAAEDRMQRMLEEGRTAAARDSPVSLPRATRREAERQEAYSTLAQPTGMEMGWNGAQQSLLPMSHPAVDARPESQLQSTNATAPVNATVASQQVGRRHCNCKKSGCLKLYCDCFADGNLCDATRCCCVGCSNSCESALRTDCQEHGNLIVPAAGLSRPGS